MAILKAPPKPLKNETLQIRVEEEVRSKLTRYAEFIDSSESYVISEALKLVFEMWRPGVIPTLRPGSSRYYDVQLRCHISPSVRPKKALRYLAG